MDPKEITEFTESLLDLAGVYTFDATVAKTPEHAMFNLGAAAAILDLWEGLTGLNTEDYFPRFDTISLIIIKYWANK